MDLTACFAQLILGCELVLAVAYVFAVYWLQRDSALWY